MLYDFGLVIEIRIRDFKALRKSKEGYQSGMHVISRLETDARNTDKNLEELVARLNILEEDNNNLELSCP